MNDVHEVRSAQAPQPIGPYSQAVVHGGMVYCSGQVPLDPATGKLVEGDVEAQTEQVLANLRAVLAAAGASLGSVLRTTVFLQSLDDFARMNAVYARHFTGSPKPARSTVQVAKLPLGAAVEIDVIAVVERP